MKPVIVLADHGQIDPAAISMLALHHSADVVTVTLDIGQPADVRATRDRALAAGAVRAHLVDALDDFVRECVLPALRTSPGRPSWLDGHATLAYPLIASRLVQVAHREAATVVAHGGSHALTAEIGVIDPSLIVLTVDGRPQTPCRTARVPSTSARHLLQRPVADPSVAQGLAAHVEIQFDEAVPVAINGVTLTLPELLESLSLIGGQHGIGHAEPVHAPAGVVLEAAYRALDHDSGVVRLELLDGRQRVVSSVARIPALVNRT